MKNTLNIWSQNNILRKLNAMRKNGQHRRFLKAKVIDVVKISRQGGQQSTRTISTPKKKI